MQKHPTPCPACGTEVAWGLVACPSCQRLVFADELKALAAQAEELTARVALTEALSLWRRCLELLPPGSMQARVITEKIQALSARVDRGEGAALEPAGAGPDEGKAARREDGRLKKGAAGLGALGLLVWKFKAIFVLVLTKGKLLLLGLTKGSTLFTMLLSLGVYWTLWGWKFALGIVLSIYVHEMGHVAALRKFGISAGAPAFIPGIGAVVRMNQYPANAVEDARVGLAGPLWGLGAAIGCYLGFLVTGIPILAALARVGAWINLFNLLPVVPLDGGRGFRAMNRPQRWIAVATLGGAFFLTRDGLLALLAIVAVIRALVPPEKDLPPDRTAAIQYVTLVVVLSALSALGVPGLPESGAR